MNLFNHGKKKVRLMDKLVRMSSEANNIKWEYDASYEMEEEPNEPIRAHEEQSNIPNPKNAETLSSDDYCSRGDDVEVEYVYSEDIKESSNSVNSSVPESKTTINHRNKPVSDNHIYDELDYDLSPRVQTNQNNAPVPEDNVMKNQYLKYFEYCKQKKIVISSIVGLFLFGIVVVCVAFALKGIETNLTVCI